MRQLLVLAALVAPAALAQSGDRPVRLAIVVDAFGPDVLAGVGAQVDLDRRWTLTAAVSRHTFETEAPESTLFLGPGIDQDALGVEVGVLSRTPVGTTVMAGLGLVASAARQSGEGGIVASGLYVEDDELRSERIETSYQETAQRLALQFASSGEFRVWRGLWLGAETRVGPARAAFTQSETIRFGDGTPRRADNSGEGWQWATDVRIRAVLRF